MAETTETTEPTEAQPQSAEDLAYAAGRQALSEPAERRSVAACPFSPVDHPEERTAWLNGFADAAEEAQPDIDAIRAEIAEAQNA